MMSDDSDMSLVPNSLRSSFGGDGNFDFPSDPPMPEPQDEGLGKGKEGLTGAEYAFYTAIQISVEDNVTSWSLNNCGIRNHWVRHLEMLNQVVVVPPDDSTEVPDERQYRSMEPKLHLNLADNELTYISLNLFNLQFLTGLTLRGNDLEVIPPEIAQLVNLQNLDLSNNLIRTLPCEILTLCMEDGPLLRISLVDNPLCEVGDLNTRTQSKMARCLNPTMDVGDNFSLIATDPEGLIFPEDFLARELRDRCPHIDFCGHHRFTPPPQGHQVYSFLYLVSRTTVAYYDQAGDLLDDSPLLPMKEAAEYCPTYGERTQPGLMIHTILGAYNVPDEWFTPPSRSSVPSLLTRSLVTAYNFCEGQPDAVREELSMFMGPDNDLPVNAATSLAVADYNMAQFQKPLRVCHVCGKEYIVARAEWVEGWFFNHQVVPVKVVVCSWGCVPDIIADKPEPLKWRVIEEVEDDESTLEDPVVEEPVLEI